MARKKKSMIGFDPLAWLSEEESSEEDKKSVKKKTVKNKVEKPKPVKVETVQVSVLGKTIDRTALEKGYDLIKDSMTEVVSDFYATLFSRHPDVKPLFDNTNEADRASKLSAALKLLIDNIEDAAALHSVLEDLGKRHKAYGAEEVYYIAVADVLIETCKQHAGRSWTKKVTAAWQTLLTGVAETMLAAYPQQDAVAQQVEMAEENKTESVDDNVLMLTGIQDISQSESLKKDMLELVKNNTEVKIDASNVSRVDGSTLQLLCGLFAYAKTNSIKLVWVDPSEALMMSAEYLGIKEQIELDYFGLF